MKIKIVIEADIDVNEVKKNPVIRILKQLKKLDKPDPLPIITTPANTDNLVFVVPADHTLRFS